MELSKHFFINLLDSLVDQVTVINHTADIIYSNRSWVRFALENDIKGDPSCIGQNYLTVCDLAAQAGDDDSAIVAEGLRKVMLDGAPIFNYEYPCHSPEQERWFQVCIKPFQSDKQPYYVLTHHNITQRKLAERKVALLATLDGLTNIANRRKFKEFFEQQWAIHSRLEKPLSLLMIDIDHFKQINDNYGHAFGDECLRRLASLLRKRIKRPYDICARYGGEEFVILLGHSDLDAATTVGNSLLSCVNRLVSFPDEPVAPIKQLSVSIGAVSVYPDPSISPQQVMEYADGLMYQSKHNGRNQLTAEMFATIVPPKPNNHNGGISA